MWHRFLFFNTALLCLSLTLTAPAQAMSLQEAVETGQSEQVMSWLHQHPGPEVCQARVTWGKTHYLHEGHLVFWAAEKKAETLLQTLIDQGCSLTGQDNRGTTLLMYAVSSGNLALTQLLLTQGAKVQAQDDTGETPLMYAVSSGKLELVQTLVEQGANVNAGSVK